MDYDDELNEEEIIQQQQQTANQSELQIWSLQISNLERILAHNCMLTFLEHRQSTQHG
jgi:hypothetical protein